MCKYVQEFGTNSQFGIFFLLATYNLFGGKLFNNAFCFFLFVYSRKDSIVVRTQLSVRVHLIIGKWIFYFGDENGKEENET